LIDSYLCNLSSFSNAFALSVLTTGGPSRDLSLLLKQV
jgi:hypothetical protein